MRQKYVGDDVRARLGGTVIRYRGKPYYCEVGGSSISLINIANRLVEHNNIPFDDAELDISSLDLGYVNITTPVECAVHTARVGNRRYKQGVDFRTLTYDVLTLPTEKFAFNWENMFCQGFIDAYEGKYPTVDEALKKIAKKRSIALSNDVAIMREKDLIKVYVKNEEVGWMKAGTKKVIIPPTPTSWMYHYYLERLEGWTVTEGVGG